MKKTRLKSVDGDPVGKGKNEVGSRSSGEEELALAHLLRLDTQSEEEKPLQPIVPCRQKLSGAQGRKTRGDSGRERSSWDLQRAKQLLFLSSVSQSLTFRDSVLEL
jgi:hypothetical protein